VAGRASAIPAFCRNPVNERFYEKVIKVKADVAASLICFPTLA